MAPTVPGGFEEQVLLTILRLGPEAHSALIVLELEQRTGRAVGAWKVYVSLRRLEKTGFLRSRFDPPPGKEGGRDRRVFVLMEPALEILEASNESLHSPRVGRPVPDEF